MCIPTRCLTFASLEIDIASSRDACVLSSRSFWLRKVVSQKNQSALAMDSGGSLNASPEYDQIICSQVFTSFSPRKEACCSSGPERPLNSSLSLSLFSTTENPRESFVCCTLKARTILLFSSGISDSGAMGCQDNG